MKRIKLPLFLAIVIILVTGCSKKNSNEGVEVSGKNDTNIESTVTVTPTATEVVLPEDDDKTKVLYPAYTVVNEDKRYGYMDDKGNFVIEPVYYSASDFSEGYAVVTDTTGKSLLIDTAGKIIYKSPYTISPFKNGASVVSVESENSLKSGYVDGTGKLIIDPIYDRADSFNSNNQAYVLIDDTISLIDKNGTVLESHKLAPEYSNMDQFVDGYVVYTNEGGKTGVVNYKGESVLSFEYTSAYSVYSAIQYLGNDLFAVMGEMEEGKEHFNSYYRPFALYNNKGEQLTEFTLYDVSTFSENYVSVTDDTNTYFIDTNGKEVTSLPKLEGRGTMTISNGIVKAEVDNSLLYLKKDGTILWKMADETTLPSGVTVKSFKFKPNKYVVVNYPVIEGMSSEEIQKSVNDRLKDIFISPRTGLTKDDELTVEDDYTASQLGNLLIIIQTGYDYYFGAAHGMPIKQYYFVDLTTGVFYSLADLFIKDTDYITPINTIIQTKIESADSEEDFYFEDSFDSIADNQNFFLEQDGITLYFYPYEIAPYAAGFPEFKISFDELTNVIDKEGDFWKAFQK
ncbi:hypothetical protein acsn021_20790 [Anaerocolumna cellulosilytica]|uniref:Uncharacterized protein n=1 Tax=Anaerocolumna cellulosilytica TaxID=433286 RepID=A0A6S6R518_9FIRM|nr:WG repeat-containing protein [Anaerocolumna cellulosilytica]MBB5194278.1 hypothetical protein [Anaerocolumna cellulosilytica]BCJ94510.1 hypothetical protein acsn021_20790 [Anaerocolumna cellulosilytica]